jgi:hypothetical protein
VNHSHSFIKESFYWSFTMGKDIKQGCSGNEGPELPAMQGPHSQNSPVQGPLPYRTDCKKLYEQIMNIATSEM